MLTWYAFKAGLKKFWSFMRRYGWIIIVAIVLIVIVIVSMGGKIAARDTISSLWRVIKTERELHQELVDETNQIHADEVKAVEDAGKRAIDAVKQAEEAFRDREDELDAAKKKRIQKIVKKNKNDPDKAAKELADQFGFVFVHSE